ncbi:MAG: dihydropteroate synthase, partial [Gammaproteobacteria bacterium]
MLNANPQIMGILNVTPDSFSDGGKYLSVTDAAARAEELVKEGASIVDIGGESSRPGASVVPSEEQLKRILPV